MARLEQFDFSAAAEAFRRALQIQPDLAIARLNLAIARFYAGELESARREAEAARENAGTQVHASYLLGLIARSENRTADAIALFGRVQQADPDDVGSAVNLGQLYTQEQKFKEAIELLQRATRLEPYHSTAAYALATALLRSGAREEGATAMARFQELRTSGYATSFSQNYLEQGRYAAAVASTGAEPELVAEETPPVRFVEATADALPSPAPAGARGVTLADIDADGDLDLIVSADAGVRLLHNARGILTPAMNDRLPPLSGATAVVAGDYDNDGRMDLFAITRERGHLLRQRDDGSFEDQTAKAGIPAARSLTAAWADADHDGDLDLLFSGGVARPWLMDVPSADAADSTRLLRNNGDGTFADVTRAAGIPSGTRALAVAPGDFDNRRDIDFLLLGPETPLLLRNMRDGTFRDAAADVRLTASAGWTSVASGDVNKDGFTDLFLGRLGAPGLFAVSDGSGRFRLTEAPAPTTRALAAVFADYDNDGLIDLVINSGRRSPIVLRHVGGRWIDVSAEAIQGRGPAGPAGESSPTYVAGPLSDADARLAAGDLDGDGDVDLVSLLGGGLSIWRNDGGDRHPSLRVRLQARVSNRSSVGARVELRAGSLTQQVETVSATPSPAPADIVFGLGPRGGADVVRVLWPAGILQAEVAESSDGARRDVPTLSGLLTIQELDRKPSSCPYLYTWNGSGFEFVTDFLGGGELGYWVAPGVRNTPDPDEYVRIESRQLQPLNGRYELRVTNELEEALFLDRMQLLAVSHPEGTEVYPAEGMGARAQRSPLYAVRNARPPLRAIDDDGHDVLDRIAALDRKYPDHLTLAPMRGYAAPHHLTLTIPPYRPGTRVLLLLTGWTDYAFSRDNVAASQSGRRLEPPSLQVKEGANGWHTVVENVGVPVGRPQTVPLDLTDALPAGATELRIRTTMRIYWDRILVDTSNEPAPVDIARLEPSAADLRWRGFSAETTPDGREPFGYDYSRVSFTSPWKLMPGRYTREGDVRELLDDVDDLFVVSRPGDAISLAFDAGTLPPLRSGWTRTFLLYAAGYSKEMDPHSSSPDALAPLPFHGMSAYPYPAAERYPDTPRHREYLERYNTRIVTTTVPRIELWLRAQ